MTLLVHLRLAAIDADSIGKVVLVVVFVFWPIAKKLLDAARNAGPARRATLPPRSRPAQRLPDSKPLPPFTWEDLMSGRVPEPGGAAEPVPERAPEVPERAGAPMPEFEEMEPRLSESVLAELPSEDDLEKTGGDEIGRLPAPGGPMGSAEGVETLVPDYAGAGENVTSFNVWEEGALARRAYRSSWRPRRGAWRRALVVSELLGVPATMRRDGSFPGPPLGLS